MQLSQAIFVACNLTVHTVRQIAEIFTCKIFPLKHAVCTIITMVLSMEEETVIMHCCYCTCVATSSLPMTRTELLDMDIVKTSLRSTSSINLIYQHPFLSTSVISDIISYQCQLSKWGNDLSPLNRFCWKRYLTSQTNHWAIWLADLEGTGKVSCNKLQEIEQCSKPRDSCMQLLKVARDMLQAGTRWEICCCKKIAANNCLVCTDL